jgi:hypothetical protein
LGKIVGVYCCFYKRSVEVSLVLLVDVVSCEEGEEEGGAEGLL